MTELRDAPMTTEEITAIVKELKGKSPGLRIAQIIVPGRESDLFLARKCSWSEYKPVVGGSKTEADGLETIVTKFLIYPKPNFEAMQTDGDFWTPGLVANLARGIQKALGFSDNEASIKNW